MRVDEQQIQNLKTVVIYSTLGLGTGTGLFFLARHFYKKTRQIFLKSIASKKVIRQRMPSN